jgi:DNA modification methylase
MRAEEKLRRHLGAIARLANQSRRDRGYTRAIYSYPAKFQAHLPAALVRLFTVRGDLVVDPYCGGGTTGLEAFLAGRAAVGFDVNPLACLIARVKTTPIPARAAASAVAAVLASSARRDVLDAGDIDCLGADIAGEVAALAGGIGAVDAPAAVVDLLHLALIHTLKIAGRRDFAKPSILPLFSRTAARVARAVAGLPRRQPRPSFHCKSNHAMREVGDATAGLVVTSPPYKDLDVEYALIQIQRRELRRSKRSRAVWAILGESPRPKQALCGGRGAAYWAGLAPSLREIRRVLVAGALAFFWTGFKSAEDQAAFTGHLGAAGLEVAQLVPVTLGLDRVASSRSTHHGRATHMLARDFLFACVAR